jgi:exodeoxyribonuclease V alpha subunit
MENKDTTQNITKISQVTTEVTLFLRNLGFSDYYIIKIFALVGEAAIGLTEDNPYWLLEEFPTMQFAKVDEVACKMGISGDDHYRVQAAIKHGLGAFMSQGHTFVQAMEFCGYIAEKLDISRDCVVDVMEDMALAGELQLSMLDGCQVLYFYGYYRIECDVVKRIAHMAEKTPKSVGGNLDAIIKKVESGTHISLSDKQREAVKNSLCNGVSIVTGGPGTGKTTIINTLIKALEYGGMRVAVAAPTGRAAKRISQSSGKAAVTVHRLLEYYYDEGAGRMGFGRNEENPLDYEAVIVDEASMMDLMLMGALCKALKENSRLILIGDVDQLQSVGAGNVLGDLIDSGYVNTSRLTEIFRQDEESHIVLNAHRINKGEYPEYAPDFQLIPASKQNDILDKILDIAMKSSQENLQILTPTKKGIIGSKNLNEQLQKAFNPPAKDKKELKFGSTIYRTGDKVMQIKNNYQLEYKMTSGNTGKGIFNGETGIVTAVHPEDKKIVVCYDERWVEYQYIQLDEIELAYAVTVHKSQGSEFSTVVIPMSWFSPALATRNLIYTAVTRAKEKVIIVGSGDYLNAMIDNISAGKRNSGLKSRLVNMYEGI